MPRKPASGTHRSVLERVTTPLGFFTLGILIIEAILGSLSFRAAGNDLTLLICGMLTGFGLLICMVFVLTLHPRYRTALLGTPEPSMLDSIRELGLTDNDIRVVYLLSKSPRSSIEDIMQQAILGPDALPVEDRLIRLNRLNLVRRSYNGLSKKIDTSLLRRGREIADLISYFGEPIAEIYKESRT
jgi:hypothetical protein